MKIVCLTGMHRSGTSLVSRMVNLLGADLGPDDDLMPAKPDNPRGFWENRTISALNDDILAALGGRWDRAPVLEDGWEQSPRLDELRERAREVMATLTGRSDAGSVFAWKDPRNSLLLPFWATVASIDSTILTVRNPGQVAASLAARDSLESEAAADLWLHYVVSAWRSDPKRLVICYGDLFLDVDQEIERIVQHVGLPEPDDEMRKRVADFVDPALHHHTGAPLQAGPKMALAMSLFELFRSRHFGILDPLLEALQEQWLSQQASQIVMNRTETLEHELAVAVAHRDEVLEERDVAVARGEELDKTLADVVAHRNRIQAELAEADESRLEELVEAQTASLRWQVEELNRLGDAMAAERDSAQEAQHHAEERLRAQTETVNAAERTAQALRRELKAAAARIDEISRHSEALEHRIARWRLDKLESVLRRLRIVR